MYKRYFILLISILLLITSAFLFPESASLNDLKSEVNKLKADPDLSHGIFGIYVIDIKKDSVLLDYNGSIGLIPASSQKTITTAAALCLFGDNYKFETKIEYDGVLDSVKGILKGNLYIHGSGDPTLDSKYFHDEKDTVDLMQKWAKIISDRGIKKIDGAVIADASVFDDEMTPSTWIWGDIGNYFGAGASGLNYKDDMCTVYFTTGAANDSARITKIIPHIPGLVMTDQVKASGTTDNCYIFGAPYSNLRCATGTVPPDKIDFEVNGSMPDPAWYCAYALDSALKKAGIIISQRPNSVRELKMNKQYKISSRKKIFSNYSPSLAQIIYWTNRKSINLYAESLLRTIAVKQNGWGSEEVGTEVITEFWQGKGMDVGGMHLNDGCGLTRWNSVTCKQFATVMKLMAKENTFKAFYNSLPVQNPKVSAKSGYINRVRSYAGYATKKNGGLVAFSIIANNYDCTPVNMKTKLEKIMELIAELE